MCKIKKLSDVVLVSIRIPALSRRQLRQGLSLGSSLLLESGETQVQRVGFCGVQASPTQA